MALVDYDKIVNGTPTKRIINAFNSMKDNYTEESAQEFYNVYSNEPLSAILENSRLIFSEPFNGSKFYSSRISNPSKLCIFESHNDEIEAISSYVESYGNDMSDEQKDIYTTLLTEMTDTKNSMKNTIIYSSYISENVDDTFEKKLSSLLYEYTYNKDANVDYEKAFIESFEDNDPVVYLTYAPYVIKTAFENGDLFIDLASQVENIFVESDDTDSIKMTINSVLCANKLKHDDAYIEAVNTINHNYRQYFKVLMEMTLIDVLNLTKPNITVPVEDVNHYSAESAVNSLFDDIELKEVDEMAGAESKSFIDSITAFAYEQTLDLMHHEYQMTESVDDIAKGYSLLTGDDVSIEEAVGIMMNTIKSFPDSVTESENDSLKPESNGGSLPGKKPEAPILSKYDAKIQKKMDKEALKHAKRMKKQELGQKKRGFFRSVLGTPKRWVTKLQDNANKLDEIDDQRRKNYMARPGFRKKWFRNLKVAILYGTAAQFKLALVPVVAMGRHYSKKKDRRMRNELLRELQTSLDITNEKINDANASNDQQEKYHLMRIRSQLQAEITRVTLNSKYI